MWRRCKYGEILPKARRIHFYHHRHQPPSSMHNNSFANWNVVCELWVWMGERQMELRLTMVTRPTWEETALGGIRGTTRVTILVTIHVTIRVTTSSRFLTSCDNVDKLKWSWQGCFKMLKWVSRYWECRQVGQMELYQNEKCSLSTLSTHVENSREQFDRFGRWLGGCRSFLIRCRYGCATENVWGQPSNWESMVRRGHSVIEMTNTSEECQTAFVFLSLWGNGVITFKGRGCAPTFSCFGKGAKKSGKVWSFSEFFVQKWLFLKTFLDLFLI